MKAKEYASTLDNDLYEYLSTPDYMQTLGDLKANLRRYVYMYSHAETTKADPELLHKLEARITYQQQLIEDIKAGRKTLPRHFEFETKTPKKISSIKKQ